jgi:hypothetical protein
LGLEADEAGFSFFTEAVTVSLDRDDSGVMQESVQSGTGQDWIVGKDLTPLTEGLVRGNNSGDAFFVTLGDDLKKHGSLTGIKGQVTDFINDKQLWLGEHFHGVRQPVLSKSGGEFASQFQSVDEVGDREKPGADNGRDKRC